MARRFAVDRCDALAQVFTQAQSARYAMLGVQSYSVPTYLAGDPTLEAKVQT